MNTVSYFKSPSMNPFALTLTVGFCVLSSTMVSKVRSTSKNNLHEDSWSTQTLYLVPYSSAHHLVGPIGHSHLWCLFWLFSSHFLKNCYIIKQWKQKCTFHNTACCVFQYKIQKMCITPNMNRIEVMLRDECGKPSPFHTSFFIPGLECTCSMFKLN